MWAGCNWGRETFRWWVDCDGVVGRGVGGVVFEALDGNAVVFVPNGRDVKDNARRNDGWCFDFLTLDSAAPLM